MRAVAAIVGVLALLLHAPALAQDDEDRLRWNADWARVHPASYAIVGTAIAGSLIFDHFFDPGPEAQLRGPILLDAATREALMAPTQEGRSMAALASDILLGSMLAWPIVDAVAVAGIGDTNTDVLWQLTWIAGEAYAAELLVNTFMKKLFARERPFGSRCTLEDRLENPRRCGPEGRLRSFYSGHTSFAFNAAGQVCVNHAHLPLYGNDAADALACGTALLTATAVATLRIVADAHYLSDVTVGAVLGFATGFLLPYFLHYQWDPQDDVPPVRTEPARSPSAITVIGPITFGGTF